MQEFLDSVVDAFLWIPLKLYQALLSGLATVLESIPVPDWATGVSGLASGISPTVMYYVEPFNLGTGLSILFSAYGVRFLIRRIPFIG